MRAVCGPRGSPFRFCLGSLLQPESPLEVCLGNLDGLSGFLQVGRGSGLGASYTPLLSPLQLAGLAPSKAKPRMSSSSLLGESSLEPPVLLSDIKTEPPEELLATDCNQPQAEPVDLSLHKPKGSLQPPAIRSAPMPAGPPAPVVSMAPAGLGSSSAIPAVLSPGSILASTQGSGGQQILHVIHTIPSVNLPSKMGSLQTIPLVVQSLPVVYTTMPSDGVTAAITVPLIGGDGKNAGSGELCPLWVFGLRG
uniref:KLF transcription factor 8 n=1 Tax=Naja naja TaxID=35670 RepID=A0A8C6XU32_NAJNA